MIIVDGQIHLWQKGTPSAHNRQEPYLAEQAIADMDEAGVDRALVHPVLWDPDSNEVAQAAVRKYPDRFAIMGWFYLDDPKGRDIVALWKERPGMVGLRFYTNDRHPQSWFTDGTLDWLWPAADQAGVPVSLGAAMFLPTVGKNIAAPSDTGTPARSAAGHSQSSVPSVNQDCGWRSLV